MANLISGIDNGVMCNAKIGGTGHDGSELGKEFARVISTAAANINLSRSQGLAATVNHGMSR